MKYLKIAFSTVLIMYSVTMSAQLNDYFIDFLEEGLEIITVENNGVGISLSVISGDEQWSGAAGISTTQDSLNTEHVLALGSITKPVVAACILGLMEDGAVTLNDPIHMYLESREHIDSTISIKQLLNHTSGLFNYTDNTTFFDTVLINDNKVFSPEEVLESFLLEPSFAKGEKQEYSNTNYLLLGMIIEKITGRPYYEEIIDRFNLEEDYPSITVAPQIQDIEEMAHIWADLGFGQTDLQASGLTLNALFSSAGAAGAFVGSPTDLAKFGRDLLSGALLNEASMDSFYNYHPLQLSGVIDYGLGVWERETSCGKTYVGHSGGIIYTAELAYLEEYDLTVTVMTNDGDGILELDGVTGILDAIICEYEVSLTNTNDVVQEDYSINVFPNPFDQYISLEYHNDSYVPVRLEVYNELGQIIETKEYKDQQIISENVLTQSHIAPGIYYLRFTIGEKNESIKVIKI